MGYEWLLCDYLRRPGTKPLPSLRLAGNRQAQRKAKKQVVLAYASPKIATALVMNPNGYP